MRRKKSAAMFPEQRPDLLEVGLGHFQFVKFFPGYKSEITFFMRWRHLSEQRLDLKEKHQPMRLPLVTSFADQTSQMQILGRKFQTDLLLRLATSADIRRFTVGHVQLAAEGTPQTTIRFVCALEQENFAGCVEAVEQGGDFIWQRHLFFADAIKVLRGADEQAAIGHGNRRVGLTFVHFDGGKNFTIRRRHDHGSGTFTETIQLPIGPGG